MDLAFALRLRLGLGTRLFQCVEKPGGQRQAFAEASTSAISSGVRP